MTEGTEILWDHVIGTDYHLEPGMVWVKMMPKRTYRLSMSEYNKLRSTGRIVV